MNAANAVSVAMLFGCCLGCDHLFGLDHVTIALDGAGHDDGGGERDSKDSSDSNDSFDASSTSVTLREAQDDIDVNGHSDACYSGSATQDETYERTFPLTMFSITTVFHVTAVTFAAETTLGATGVTVMIGTYTGTVGAATLDLSAITMLQSAVISVPNSTTPQAISAPIDVAIPAGSVILAAITSPAYTGTNHFVVGGAAGIETLSSYFASTSCGINSPSKIDTRNGADVGTFIIDVVGY